MPSSFVESLVEELRAYFRPLTSTQGKAEAILAFLESAGWPIDRIAGVQAGALQDAVGSVIQAVDSLATLLANPPQQTEAVLLDIGQAIAPALQALARMPASWPSGLPADLSELPVDILSALTEQWLQSSHLVSYEALRVLGILVEGAPQILESGGEVYHVRNVAPRLDLNLLSALLTQPAQAFKSVYWPDSQPDLVAGAVRLADRLLALAIALGFDPYQFAVDEVDGLDMDLLPDDGLVMSYAVPLGDESVAQAGVAMASAPATASGLSVSLVPFGRLAFDVGVGDWLVGLSGNLQGQAIDIDGAGVRQRDGGKPPLALQLSLTRGDADSPAIRFGAASGSRFAVRRLAVVATAAIGGSRPEAGFRVELTPLSFRLAAGANDGFLKTLLPAEGIGAEAELTLEWSNLRGVRLGGSADLTLALARRISLGPITIVGLQAQVKPAGDRLQVRVAADVGATLGPLAAVVQGLGLELGLAAPATGGNLGPFDLALGFTPPRGIGLAIQASVVKGGGFIALDFDKQQYAGVLQLAIQKTIDVKAIGILNARLPSGQPGFSLLLIVTGEFPPIQLGMGFTLNGIGGLIGINRTAAVEVLRGGLRNGALDSILFPPDPLHNVPALLQTLSTVFPVAEGRYVFGPMVRIGWGSPTVLTLDVAVLIELPDPVRILLLGRLKASLPDDKKPVAVIRMDALGVLDFGRKELSLDASLYDSKILTFSLSGDMAMRLTWGDQPSFLLSIGGFHPSFQPPAGVPKLGRIALVLVDLDKDGVVARVALDAYFALTSNTVQFGSHVQAYVKALGVEVQGLLGFDALIHIPFAIEAQMVAAVSLSFNGAMLMGADVVLQLTGPQPWHLVGEARFVFLGVKARAPIEFTSGAGAQEAQELPAPVDVAAQLRVALEDPRNWQVAMPTEGTPDARVRAAPAGTDAGLLVHPLAGLSVRQRVAPLNRTLARFGNAPVDGGPSSFSLRSAGTLVAAQPLQEAFAAAQYQDMSDDDKLVRPSFELADAGVAFGSAGFTFPKDMVFIAPDAVYEDHIVDPASEALGGLRSLVPPSAKRRRHRPTVADGKVHALAGVREAAAQAPGRTRGKRRYAALDRG